MSGKPRFQEWYSYTQAGLANKKRLVLSQYMVSGGYYNSTATTNLDASYVYDTEGKMTSVTYPSTSAGAGPCA